LDCILTHNLTKFFNVTDEVRKGSFGSITNKLNPKKRRIVAVDHLNIAIREKELFALLGPNGAGKTTLIKLLCTLLVPDEGTAEIMGFDIVKQSEKVRQKIGVVLGGERGLYWRLTAKENLWFFSQLYNMPRSEAINSINNLVEKVGLSDCVNQRVETFSKGMKQRLHLARGLLNDPDVLLLDEPTIGLDPVAAKEIRKLILTISKKEGKTILLTTHNMYEASDLSDRVAIIELGEIIVMDKPEILRQNMSKGVLNIEIQQPPPNIEKILQIEGVVKQAVINKIDSQNDIISMRILTTGINEAPAILADTIIKAGGKIASLVSEIPTLEDVYIELTGKRFGDNEERERTFQVRSKGAGRGRRWR
jgi:ABC-2 type transport system ATP-binding protein